MVFILPLTKFAHFNRSNGIRLQLKISNELCAIKHHEGERQTDRQREREREIETERERDRERERQRKRETDRQRERGSH
ncbi:hypothetical protein DPMN_149417 [Dreissena polymorpha]|uniref:Uncharacterized protein n=1 Tax=Dreissena polymorpha TaxID=45954 RepID=A0A9D4FFX8_DREPO|nr:hypothetical protein DPMN_149417 [Dreissena polymorpha]